MPRYRKKPVEVEAHQWFKNGDHPADRVDDSGTEGAIVRYFRRPEPEYEGTKIHEACGRTWHDHGWIDTLEGGHTVCPGNWIITGVQGEFYPCRDDIFRVTYEPVDANRPPTAAVIEIIERGRSTDDAPADGIIVPDDIRINGVSLLAPADRPVKVHEIDLQDRDVVCVTLTLFARRVVIAGEGDLSGAAASAAIAVRLTAMRTREGMVDLAQPKAV